MMPVAARAIARVRWRLVPFLALLYLVAYLDRVNVGFAALEMNASLGFSGAVYGLGAGIFFIGYFLFEVPSNLILARVGARVWIARIAIVWGIVSIAMMFVRGPLSFYALRFLLGAAEAGFFPGIIYYFTLWFPARDRARAVAQFSIAGVAAGVVGGPLSGALLSMGGVADLEGWQWLFIIEGLPAVALGVVTLFYLTDRPEDARWLPDDEKAWLLQALRDDAATTAGPRSTSHEEGWRSAFRHPALWRFSIAMFFLVTSAYGFSFFLPQIVRGLSGGSNLVVGLLTAIPFSAAAVAMIAMATHSDRTGERRAHVATSATVGALGLAASTLLTDPVWSLAALTVAAMGIYSYTPVFWSLPTALFRGDAAAAGVAFINAFGNLGGFAGPYVMGWLQDVSGDFRIGVRILAAAAMLSAVLILTMRAPRLALTTKAETT